MRQFELRGLYRGREIVAQVLQLPRGIHISLYGGDLPHIGAVGIVDPEGDRTVTRFPGHKEGIVCERWTAALSAAGCCPAVVEAGIHYDGLDSEGIAAVLTVTDDLLDRTLALLNEDN